MGAIVGLLGLALWLEYGDAVMDILRARYAPSLIEPEEDDEPETSALEDLAHGERYAREIGPAAARLLNQHIGDEYSARVVLYPADERSRRQYEDAHA